MQTVKFNAKRQGQEFLMQLYKKGLENLAKQGYSADDIAPYVKSYADFRSTLNYRRRKNFESQPLTLQDLDFSRPKCIQYTVTNANKPFLRYDSKGDKYRTLLFASDTQLKWLADDSDRMHGDGTFQACSTLFKQLYIIHGYSEQAKRIFPCAWVLLQRKNFTIYDNMLSQLKVAGIEAGVEIAPKIVLTDFETGKPNTKKNLYFNLFETKPFFTCKRRHKGLQEAISKMSDQRLLFPFQTVATAVDRQKW